VTGDKKEKCFCLSPVTHHLSPKKNMPEPVKLEKAELMELDVAFDNPINPERNVKVQFNPESLKVAFANQIQAPEGGAGDQRGTPAVQFVGKGTTKLTLQLWFDVTAELTDESHKENGQPVNDVRKLTQKVSYFITPKKVDEKKYIPPSVRFIWGTFKFDGLMESLEENLEFFSPDGRPLRASMTLNLSQQEIKEFKFKPDESVGKPITPGTKPMTSAPQGANIQQLAANQGKGNNWQSVAAANGIENPRQLGAGQLLDMNASASPGASVTGGASFSAGASFSGGASLQGGVPAGSEAGASVSGGSVSATMRERRGGF
jgi:hypothetical protein